MSRTDMLTRSQRSDLCLAKGVTLDGQPAQVSGPTWGYARVVDRDGRGIDATWPTVARIVASHGKFYSHR